MAKDTEEKAEFRVYPHALLGRPWYVDGPGDKEGRPRVWATCEKEEDAKRIAEALSFAAALHGHCDVGGCTEEVYDEIEGSKFCKAHYDTVIAQGAPKRRRTE